MQPKAMYSPQNKESLNLNHNGKLTKYRERQPSQEQHLIKGKQSQLLFLCYGNQETATQLVCEVFLRFIYLKLSLDFSLLFQKLTFELPKNAKSSGECDTRSKDHPFIKLSWSTHSHDCSFTMHFEKFSKDTTTNTVTQYWMAANLTFSVKFNSKSEHFLSYFF